MFRPITVSVVVAISFALAMFLGCTNSKDTSTAKPSTGKASTSSQAHSGASAHPSDSSEEEHSHKPGAHGGTIVSLGRDSYHVEAIVETSGTLRVYMLGKEETRIQEIDIQPLVAYVKPEGATDSISIELKSQPQTGDGMGKTSLFVAELPMEARGKVLDITIPNITISGERFRLGFTTKKEEQHQEAAMPDKVSDDAEKKLYLTEGGIYTTEDIKANGSITASQKFKGFVASHDLHPKVGEKICPVTLTKANPKCAWIVGGKKYEFCCPPCVDEFVKQAKENPKEIKQPEDYIQKDSKDTP